MSHTQTTQPEIDPIIWCQEIERIVFHFNKTSNADPSVPPWVIKHKGNTYNVWHLLSTRGFSTRETPGSEHTRGSIMFRGQLKIWEEDGKAMAEVR